MELGVSRDTVARHIRASARQPNQAGRPGRPWPLRRSKTGHPGGRRREFKTGHPRGGAHRLKTGHPQEAPIGSARSKFGPSRQASRCEAVAANHPRQAPARTDGATHLPGPGELSTVSPANIPACAASSRRLGHNQPLPFRRMECEPGEEVQVDFGTRHCHSSARRQASANSRLSHGAQPLTQGLQRGGVSADHRGIHSLSGRCLLAFWRRAQGRGSGQLEGRRRATRLVRSGAEPQAARLRRTLRAGHPAHQASDTPGTKGRSKSGVGYVEKQRPQGP